MREYTDSTGVSWRVWTVTPRAYAASAPSWLPTALQAPYLCFECEQEKWRLSPAPASWEGRTDQELDILRRAGERVPRRG
jgi:hypothetical protein